MTKYLNGAGIDDKIRVQTGSDVKYFLSDHLGSTNALTDGSGIVTSSVSYDSSGNATGNLATRYKFTGREFDDFTGLHYYRARWYDSNLGRFISEDPIGFAGGDVNLYSYVKNQPLALRDPTGKLPIVLIAIGGAGVAGELALHYYLAERASSIHFSGGDPYGRKRHCYVNCMSTRLHLGNPTVVTVLGGVKEIRDTYQYIAGGNPELISDTLGDLQANQYGQFSAFVFWRSCQELCDTCQ